VQVNEPLRCRIVLLADHQAYVDELADAFNHYWSDYYQQAHADARADILACCQKDQLPIAVIALDEHDKLLGTAALKAQSALDEPSMTPWLCALLVESTSRNRGVGTRLIHAIEQLAKEMGYPRIYTVTQSIQSILRRRHWQHLRICQTHHGQADVLGLDLWR
jgi:GNAT superfamily N-acetyltransferase